MCRFDFWALWLLMMLSWWASTVRRPSSLGPGWHVRRLIVAQGCWWHSEDAPGVHRVFGIGGAVSGDAIESARLMSMGCDPGEAPGMYRNFIPNILCRAMSGQALPIAGGGVETRGWTI